jgi:hypothetical protein
LTRRFDRLFKRTILLVRTAAATCLTLFVAGWSDALRARDKSSPVIFVLGLLAAIYLWLTFFPQKGREEAIGSCIGLIAGVLALYASKLGIIFGADMVRLREPVSFGYCDRCLGTQLPEPPASENCGSNVCCTRRRGNLGSVVTQLISRVTGQ